MGRLRRCGDPRRCVAPRPGPGLTGGIGLKLKMGQALVDDLPLTARGWGRSRQAAVTRAIEETVCNM